MSAEDVVRLLRCGRCQKPNLFSSRRCTGCDDVLSADDVVTVAANPFASIIAGSESERPVHYRDDDVVIFDDAYGMSDVHLMVVPVRRITDITCLTSADVSLLERMGRLAMEQLRRRSNADVDFAVVGFNFPVSVHHLHLHAALPPFKHERICEVDRWYNLDDVIGQIKDGGRVRLWAEWNEESMPMRRRQHELAVAHSVSSSPP